MATDSYSFTPVRRRKSAFKLEICATDSTPWTATRCQRLLRTLKSRAEILKKQSERFPSANTNCDLLARKTSTPKVFKRAERHDLEWGHASKRARRTYAGRAKGRSDIACAQYSESREAVRNSTTSKT